MATPGLDLLADTASRLRALHSTTDTNATTCRYYDSAAWGERWPNLLPANHAHEVEVAMAPRFRTLEGERDAPIYVDGQPLFGEEEAALVLLGMTPADGEMEVEETEE